VRSEQGSPTIGQGGGVCVPDPNVPGERWFFQDGLRSVHVYHLQEKRFAASLEEVDALFASGSSVEAVRALRFPELLRFHDGQWKSIWSCDGAPRSRAFAGTGAAAAFDLGDGVWAVGQVGGGLLGGKKLRPDPRSEVVGVAKIKKSQLAGLILLDGEKRELHHEGLSFRRLVTKAASPILGVAVGVHHPLLAYWTAGGGLELLSLESGRSRSLLEDRG
jgi:hypothetical protein